MGMISSTAQEVSNITKQFIRAGVDLVGILMFKGAEVLAGVKNFYPIVAQIISGRLAAATVPAAAEYNWLSRFVAGRAPSILGQIVTAAIDMSLFAIILDKPILTVMIAYLPAALAMNFLIRPAIADALRQIPGFGWLGNILAPGEKEQQAQQPKRRQQSASFEATPQLAYA